VEAQRAWLPTERMPAYAPALNPVEGVWNRVKGGALAKRGDDTVGADRARRRRAPQGPNPAALALRLPGADWAHPMNDPVNRINQRGRE
jgi:hypothetical protein